MNEMFLEGENISRLTKKFFVTAVSLYASQTFSLPSEIFRNRKNIYNIWRGGGIHAS